MNEVEVNIKHFFNGIRGSWGRVKWNVTMSFLDLFCIVMNASLGKWFFVGLFVTLWAVKWASVIKLTDWNRCPKSEIIRRQKTKWFRDGAPKR